MYGKDDVLSQLQTECDDQTAVQPGRVDPTTAMRHHPRTHLLRPQEGQRMSHLQNNGGVPGALQERRR